MPTAEEIRQEAALVSDPAPRMINVTDLPPPPSAPTMARAGESNGNQSPPVTSQAIDQAPKKPSQKPRKNFTPAEDYSPFFNEVVTGKSLKEENKYLNEIAGEFIQGADLRTHRLQYQEQQLSPWLDFDARRKEFAYKRELERQEWDAANRPTFLQSMSAMLEEENFISSVVAGIPVPDDLVEPGYSPFDDPIIQGYERYSSLWYLSTHPLETQAIIQNIQRQIDNRQIIAKSSTPMNLISGLTAGMGSPVTLAFMVGMPAAMTMAGIKATSTASKIGYGAFIGASATSVEEVLLHNQNSLRTLDESALNLAAGLLLDITLGTAGVAAMKGSQLYKDAQLDAIEYLAKGAQDINIHEKPTGFSAGAMESNAPVIDSTGVTIKDPLRWAVFKTALFMSRITPLGRLLQSKSAATRQLTLDLIETDISVTGGSGRFSVESLMNRDISQTAQALLQVDELVRKAKKTRGMDEATFYDKMDEALRKADISEIPEVQQAAQIWRKRVDELYTRAAKAGVPHTFKEVKEYDPVTRTWKVVDRVPLTQKTAPSYALRQYDKNLVFDNRKSFYDALAEGIERHRLRTNAEVDIELADFKKANKKELSDADNLIANTRQEVVNHESALRNKQTAIEGNSREIGRLKAINPDDPRIKELQARIDTIKKDAKKIKENIKKLKADLSNAKEFKAKYKAKLEDINSKYIKQMDEDELLSYQDSYYQSVMGLKMGDMQIGIEPIPSIFKHRQPIDDDLIRPFLVKNSRDHLISITNQLSPRIHLMERFGEIELTNGLNRIDSEFNAKIERATSQKEVAALKQQKKNNLRDIQAVRDRLLMRVHSTLGAANGVGDSIARSLLYYNIITKLGGQLLSSIPETGKLMARYGFGKFLAANYKGLKNLTSSVKGLGGDRAFKLGAAASRATLVRPAQTFDVFDATPTNKLERMLQTGANLTQKISLQQWFDGTFRGLAATLAADAFVDSVKKGELTKLSKIGFSTPEIEILQREIGKAQKVDGLWNPNINEWDLSGKAAGYNPNKLIEKYETMLIKETNFTVIKPGAGDRPLFMDNLLARVLLQFKSFVVAATNRTMLPMSQQAGKFYRHTFTMGALGILGYMAYQTFKGEEIKTDIDTLAWEGLLRGGFLGYATDLAAMANKSIGILPDASRYQSRNTIGALAGPTAGTIQDILSAFNVKRDEEGTLGTSVDSRLRAARKLIPWQNHWAIRQPLDHLEGGIAKALGGTGVYADPKQKAKSNAIKY